MRSKNELFPFPNIGMAISLFCLSQTSKAVKSEQRKIKHYFRNSQFLVYRKCNQTSLFYVLPLIDFQIYCLNLNLNNKVNEIKNARQSRPVTKISDTLSKKLYFQQLTATPKLIFFYCFIRKEICYRFYIL